MQTLSDYLNAPAAAQDDYREANGWDKPTAAHLGTYPGPLYEASRVTARLANRRTPTHRGAPRDA